MQDAGIKVTVYFVLTQSNKLLKTTVSKEVAVLYRSIYDSFHAIEKRKATIRKKTVIV